MHRHMSVLGTENKNLVTRPVKQTFHGVVNDHKKDQYKNLRRSVSLERSGESSNSSSFKHVKDSVTHSLQEELILHKEKAISLMDEIKSSVKVPLTSSLISLYHKEMEHVFELSTNIDTMYEKELKFLMQQEKLLSAGGKSSLLEEFQKLEDVLRCINAWLRPRLVKIMHAWSTHDFRKCVVTWRGSDQYNIFEINTEKFKLKYCCFIAIFVYLEDITAYTPFLR